MEIGIEHYLTVAAMLFTLGVFGIFLNRKNVIIICLMCVGRQAAMKVIFCHRHSCCSIALETWNDFLDNDEDKSALTLSDVK